MKQWHVGMMGVMSRRVYDGVLRDARAPAALSRTDKGRGAVENAASVGNGWCNPLSGATP